MEEKAVFSLDSSWLGQGEIVFSWEKSDTLLAVCGTSNIVYILDRQGKKYTELSLPESTPVKSLDWDKDGEVLAILQDRLPHIIVWNINTNTCTELEVGANDNPTLIKWSLTQPVLAIGSIKGGLVFYNKATQRKIPTVGRHSLQVIAGDWNEEDLVITASDDKTLTVSTMVGDTQSSGAPIKSPAVNIKWGLKGLVTLLLRTENLLFYNTVSQGPPTEIGFEPEYGRVLYFEWYSNDKIVVGCSEGYVVGISSNPSEIGNEIFSVKMSNVTLDALCVCRSQNKAAIAGDNKIKVLNLNNFKEVKADTIDIPFEAGRVTGLYWTQDGQILTASTTSGQLLNYLMIIPSMNCSFGTTVAVLTGLTEVSLVDCQGGVKEINMISLEQEPSSMSLGSNYLAISQNNTAWFYKWKQENDVIGGGVCVKRKDSRGRIREIAVNQRWGASLSEGNCSLYLIEGEGKEKDFPEDRDSQIVTIVMTPHFLFLADTQNKIRTYHIEEESFVSEIRVEAEIEKIYPNFSGTRLVVQDMTGGGILYTPVNEKKLPIPNFSSKVKKVVWDVMDHNMFCVCEPDRVLGFLYTPVSIKGASIEPIRELLSIEELESTLRESTTLIEKSQKPIFVMNGILFCESESQGTIKGNFLSSHSYISLWRGKSDTSEGHYRYFLENLVLKRFSHCYQAAERLGGVKIPETLGNCALESLDLETAERAYLLSKNVGMVYAIRSVKHESEKQILLGHVSMILNEHEQAEEYYLNSSQPHLALDLRSDLQDWVVALQLAHSISPDKEPVLSKKLGLQLETQGNYSDALQLFEKAASTMESVGLSPEELNLNMTQCYAGVARNSIRTGDITRGYRIALEINDPELKVDCAQVCEIMKHYREAAELYQRGGQPEKAASLYIKLKMWDQVYGIMDLITTEKLKIQLAKAKESEGNFKEAEEVYTKANDYESVIRLNLGPLNNPDKARSLIVSKCPTQSAAAMMAEFYERKGDKPNAIEFLVLADKKEDAFVMAQSFDLMEIYADTVIKRDASSPEEHMRIAQYFEGRRKQGLAARHYEKSGNLQKALQLYMHSGEEFYMEAIKMAGRAKSDMIFVQLQDFFMGEIDMIPKEPKYIYELNMEMGKLKDAATAVLIIVEEEQNGGNYKAAHDILFKIVRDMRANRFKVPQAVINKLMIIHSYILVKRYVSLQDHLSAALLLDRVAKNISQFPAHTVQILTSTVIECIRGGLKERSYNWACVLVRSDYRNMLDEKYKKQIEKVAMKRPKSQDLEEETTVCPFCNAFIYAFELECSSCKNTLPFCLASGKHMVSKEWSKCPSCGFPANINDFIKILEADPNCPMCEASVSPSELKLVGDPMSELKLINGGDQEED